MSTTSTIAAVATSERRALDARLQEWAERASAEHEAAVAAAAAYATKIGSGPSAAVEEF